MSFEIHLTRQRTLQRTFLKISVNQWLFDWAMRM